MSDTNKCIAECGKDEKCKQVVINKKTKACYPMNQKSHLDQDN